MRIIGCLFVILPVFLFYVFRNKKEDLFSPLNAFTLLFIIKILISLIGITNVNRIDEDNGFLYSALTDDSSFLEYCILQSIGYILVLFGISIALRRTKKIDQSGITISPILSRSYMFWGILFFLTGILGFILIMRKVGGVGYFFSNLHLRRVLVRDLDFESMLLSFMDKGPMLIIFSKKYSGKKLSIIDFLMILITGLMSGLGGRKALLMLVIECVFIYHYAIRKIQIKNLLKPIYVVIAVLLFFFFSIYSQFRREGAMEEFLKNPIAFYQENSSGDVVETVVGESYVPFYIAIIYYFRDHDFWLGSSFKGLLTAPIPSSMYPNKPPVDDGMYLYSIAQGRPNIKPTMPAKSLDGTSWPLETFGSMYANYGIPGVLIGMFILGLIIGWSYKKMVKSQFGFLWLLMYVNVLFTFELSTLRIFQIILLYITLAIVASLAKRMHL